MLASRSLFCLGLGLGLSLSACRTTASRELSAAEESGQNQQLFNCLDRLSAYSEGKVTPLLWQSGSAQPYRFAVMREDEASTTHIWVEDETGHLYRLDMPSPATHHCPDEEAADTAFTCVSVALPLPNKPMVALGMAMADAGAKVTEFTALTPSNQADYASYTPAQLVPVSQKANLVRNDVVYRLRMLEEDAAAYRQRSALDEAKAVEEAAKATKIACEQALR